MTKHTAESLQKAFKYLFPDEVPALKELARSLPENCHIVNIGAGAGTSTLAFREAIDGWFTLTSIDITRESNPFGSLDAEKKILEDAGMWGNWIAQKCEDSKQVGLSYQKIKDEPLCDLVFVDGDHSYEGCKGDIEAWLPNIKPGGIIAVHDYKKSELYAHDKDYQPDKPHPKPWPGVDKAVDELLTGKYELIMRVDSLVAFRVR